MTGSAPSPPTGCRASGRSARRPAGQRQQPAGRRQLSLFPADRRLGPAACARSGSKSCWAAPAIWMRIAVRGGPARRHLRPGESSSCPTCCSRAVAPSTARAARGARAWDRRMHAPIGRSRCCSPPGTTSSAARSTRDELGPLFPALPRSARRLPAPRARRTARSGATTSPRRRSRPAPSRSAAAFGRRGGTRAGRYGPDWRQWRWGDAHPAVLAHRPFEQSQWLRGWFSRVLPVGGDGSTVNVAHAGRDPRRDCVRGGPWPPATGRSTILADPTGRRWVAATGQSGHPLSRHYADLTAVVAGRPLPADDHAIPSRHCRRDRHARAAASSTDGRHSYSNLRDIAHTG